MTAHCRGSHIPQTAAQMAITSITQERARQDRLFGEQNHDAGTWALILLEEIGEWARAELASKFNGPPHEAANRHTEAVHTAAVACAIVEAMNRAALRGDIGAE